jgi:hypothetical protein
VKKSLVVALASTLLLTGCGAQSQIYAASKSEGVYFTVPNKWTSVSNAALNKFEAKSAQGEAAQRQELVTWQIAYSKNSKVKPAQIFSIDAPKTPLAFARIRKLSAEEINAVSYNVLRDVIVPLSQWVSSPTADTPKFDIYDDYEVVEKGARGVRTIFTFTHKGVAQTIDQTAMVSTDHSKIYLFIIRCANSCYKKNEKLMTEISNSFTVRGSK